MLSTVLAVSVWMAAPSPGASPVRLRVPPPTPPARPTLVSAKRPSSLRVEWFGLRAGLGLSWMWYYSLGLGGELTFFTLVWRHFYWEILRGGWYLPYGPHIGTAFGYPFRVGGRERHQIRLGVHISLQYAIGYQISGLQLYYQYRLKRRVALQAGLMIFAIPPGGVVTFGFAI